MVHPLLTGASLFACSFDRPDRQVSDRESDNRQKDDGNEKEQGDPRPIAFCQEYDRDDEHDGARHQLASQSPHGCAERRPILGSLDPAIVPGPRSRR